MNECGTCCMEGISGRMDESRSTIQNDGFGVRMKEVQWQQGIPKRMEWQENGKTEEKVSKQIKAEKSVKMSSAVKQMK